MSALHDCFAITAPGLAPLAAAELRALGVTNARASDAGVTFRADYATLVRANLWLRTASRVIVRLATFRADAFHELERRARKVPWERIVDPARPVALRVTCRKSKLMHSGAVAQRIGDAITRATGAVVVKSAVKDDATDDAVDEASPPQLFIVRFDHDECTISADSSGALLHQRGYRLAVAKAPMRETLAAALLLSAGYDGRGPLIDPMCGAGTIAIEGALIARRLAPGRARPFACEAWPEGNAAVAAQQRADASAQARPAAAAPIVATDRDAGAIEATLANAARAGVAADITAACRPFSALEPVGEKGLLATNPPYGVRLGDTKALRDLYARIGSVSRERLGGWRVAMLSADKRLDGQAGLAWREALRTTTGGIGVRFLLADIADGA